MGLHPVDYIRFLDIAIFGFSMGTAVLININAWKLRNRVAGNPGLVPWHITAVTLAMFVSYGWNVTEVLSRFGEGVSLRTPALLFIGILFSLAMHIIYKVQTSRIRMSRAIESISYPDPAHVKNRRS